MKIGVDGRTIQDSKMAGIGTYAFEIISHFRDECQLYLNANLSNSYLDKSKNIQKYTLRFPSYRWKFEQIWELTALPIMASKYKPDIFWGPRFFVPPKLKCPSVCTIHDIAFKLIPGVVNAKQLAYFERLLSYSIKSADHFISVSNATKADFCNNYGVDPDRVSVVYNGYNKQFDEILDPVTIASTLSKLNIQTSFILFLGTLEPRKNLKRLVKAYMNSKALRNDVALVLSGKIGWEDKSFFEEIQPLINRKKIIVTGYVSRLQLRALLQSCMIFAFPSLYEGFGIPVLEAMASGAPVLTSNNSSLRELFKGYSLLVDPLSVESIKAGIENYMDETVRQFYILKSKELVQNFSWEKCSEEHVKVFSGIV